MEKRPSRKSGLHMTTHKALLGPGQVEQKLKVGKWELSFTHLDKLYWPKEKIAKRDLLNYYHAVAEFILPYLRNRCHSLNRFPNGIEGLSFFQKDVTGKVPAWLTRYTYVNESDGEKREFLVCTDEASLLYMANLGCIEMNPWHSRIKSPDNPDWCILDLDPDDNPFDQVVEVALAVKNFLDPLGIPCCCKTSGATGMHLYVPLGARYHYDQSRQFAELVARQIHRQLPAITSVERNPARRRGKIYLDFLQNGLNQTVAAPYSLRPKPGATVSTPLHWEEVKKGLKKDRFTMNNTLDRVRHEGDVFKPVLGKGINLEQAVRDLRDLENGKNS